MKLENTTLSEISQTQKDKHCIIPLIRRVLEYRDRDKVEMVVARGCGEREGKIFSHGYHFSLGGWWCITM